MECPSLLTCMSSDVRQHSGISFSFACDLRLGFALGVVRK